jgi:hypothetical protein
MNNMATEQDAERYDLEFNSDPAIGVIQRLRVRWEDNGTVTALEWWRNPATMQGYGWRKWAGFSGVTLHGVPMARSDFAPETRTVRCAGADANKYTQRVELQGVRQQHLA